MYESYQWPGAYSLKDEVKLFAKLLKELLDGVLKGIEKHERKI